MKHLPLEPSRVLTRAGTMLRLVQQGLRAMEKGRMEEGEHDRVLLEFFAVVVFGRSVSLALQNLRKIDRTAFNSWYEPWQQEMQDDRLMRWFYKLRSDILHGIDPGIGIVIGSYGRDDRWPGAITVDDRPPPSVHRGQSIQDLMMIHLCRLYATYLEEMFDSAAPAVCQVPLPTRQISSGR